MAVAIAAVLFASLFVGALCIPSVPEGLTSEQLDEVLRLQESPTSQRSARATANQKWLNLVEDYARNQMSGSSVPRPFRLDLPISGRDESLPILVLPVPIYERSCTCVEDVNENKVSKTPVAVTKLSASDDDDRDDFSAPFGAFVPQFPGSSGKINNRKGNNDQNNLVSPGLNTVSSESNTPSITSTAVLLPDDDRSDFVPPPMSTTLQPPTAAVPAVPAENDDKSDFVPPLPTTSTPKPKQANQVVTGSISSIFGTPDNVPQAGRPFTAPFSSGLLNSLSSNPSESTGPVNNVFSAPFPSVNTKRPLGNTGSVNEVFESEIPSLSIRRPQLNVASVNSILGAQFPSVTTRRPFENTGLINNNIPAQFPSVTTRRPFPSSTTRGPLSNNLPVKNVFPPFPIQEQPQFNEPGFAPLPPSTTQEPLQSFPIDYVLDVPVETNNVQISGRNLVEQFKQQVAEGQELPPALLPDSVVGLGAVPALDSLIPGPEPPKPRWDRSLQISGEVTVPRAGYTETYGVWWDSDTGASRVMMHGGSSSAYVEQMADGSYRYSSMTEDNSGSVRVRRCAVAAPQSASTPKQAVPTLPDPEPFAFAGYADMPEGRTEVWRHTVRESDRGEELDYHHQMLLRRSSNGQPQPISYSVSVDSSVLGVGSDSWSHRYTEVREQQHNAADLGLDTASSCDVMETVDMADPEESARVQPLAEFTLPIHHPRYKPAMQKYMAEFQRVYVDNEEEVVRRNQFMQHSRFISSCNREGGTFAVEANFLADRLDAELEVLFGVIEDAEGIAAELFPHTDTEVKELNKTLPDEFDWRKEGAVSHVRYQGSCSSCWAIAVGGAVEGALFVRTRRLTPLAEQCLVDCAHVYGAHGCSGTWPSHAYDYVQERGLPGLNEYGPHKEKVERCREKEVPPVTHISAHVNVTNDDFAALKVAIKEHSPSVVIIDAKPKSFIFYKKGILYDDRCAKKRPKLNHAVLAVGWGPDYVTVKNSWSAAWGEAGYARLHAPSSTCGVLAIPSYPRLEDSDVDRR